MKYLIMECHPGYAVALDEEGNFLKVANKGFAVGQTLTEVLPMRQPERKGLPKWLYALGAMAACLVLVLGLAFPGLRPSTAYASVYIRINPEIRIDVDKKDRVVGLEGVNQDGADLIADYSYRKKTLEQVTNELMDRAVEMGYLQADGEISISLDSQDRLWVEDHVQHVSGHLQNHLQEKITVAIHVYTSHESYQAHKGSHGEDHDDDHYEDDWDGDHDDDWDDHVDYDDYDDDKDDHHKVHSKHHG